MALGPGNEMRPKDTQVDWKCPVAEPLSHLTLLITKMQIQITNLNSSAIETLVLSDKGGAVVEFTSSPRLYTYALAKDTDVEALADELANAESVGVKFNALLRDGVFTAV
jgi:hypothetical protein